MPRENLKTISTLNFKTEVLGASVPVVVDFWADWCGPCRALAPVIEELSDEYGGRIVFGALNIDENRSLAGEFGIQTIPALLIFKGGSIVQQIMGMRPKAEIKSLIDRHLNHHDG